MALSTSTGAEVQRPLASVVIGGLVTSMLLKLLLLPVLYQWIFENERVTDEKQHLEEHAISA
jgi:cobalt-zinc-cadmium resistance protein CzcA